MKPVELMSEEEQQAYHMAVRKAQLAGDDGVLPDGRTVRQAREEYIEKCKSDPYRTRTMLEVTKERVLDPVVAAMSASGILEGSDFPVVAAELPGTEDDPKVANKRCC
jgi:hypothetical protein